MLKKMYPFLIIQFLLCNIAVALPTIDDLLRKELAKGHAHRVYLYGLQRFWDDPQREKVSELGSRALASFGELETERDQHLNRLKLSRYAFKAGLEDLAKSQAKIVLDGLKDTYGSVEVARKFKKSGMDESTRLAALRGVDLMTKTEQGWELYSLRALLKEFDEPKALERVLVRLASQEDKCFLRLDELHADLFAIKSMKYSAAVARKIVRVLDEEQFGYAWYHHVAVNMHNRGAFADARILMDRAFQADNLQLLYSHRMLVKHIVSARKMGFEDLAKKGRRVFLETFKRQATLSSLSCHLKSVLEGEEVNLAKQMTSAALKGPENFFHFEDGIRVIELLTEHKLHSLARSVYEKLRLSCDPKEMFTFIRVEKGMTSLTPMQALVFLVHLAKINQWDDFTEGCAGPIISNTLAYPFFESVKHLTSLLEWLAEAMEKLEYRREAERVRYYLHEAEAPSMMHTPSVGPNVGQIYWVKLNGAKGAEIIKTRPCIVVAPPSQYSEKTVVRVVPISSQERVAGPRILLSIDGVDKYGMPLYLPYQEGRLDQIRTVDTSRFKKQYGMLEPHDRIRVLLAVKDSFPF